MHFLGCFLRRICVYDPEIPNTVNCGIQDISNIALTHQHLSHSHHQDLDFVLFVRPVEEGDTGILPKEGG